MPSLRPLLAIVAAALLAAGCGTVSVEVTSETDIGKVDIDEAAQTPPVTETSPPPSTTEAAQATDLNAQSLDNPDDADEASSSTSTTAAPSSTTTSTSTTSTTTTSTTTTSTTTTTTSTTTTAAPSIALEYHQVDYGVFARAGDLDIRMPVARYETVGFHEAGHDGAFQLEVLNVADWRTLGTRGRGTGSRSAADIVVAVGDPILSPIDGTVIRAGSYTLYCDHTDNFIVIEPTGRPGWELKIFHFEGLSAAVGDEVVAATTQIGTSGRVLPFESQVDEFTAEPSNPHVHIEVIDTSIPRKPSSGGGC